MTVPIFFKKSQSCPGYWHEGVEQFKRLVPLNDSFFAEQKRPNGPHRVFTFVGSYNEYSNGGPEIGKNEIVDLQGDWTRLPDQSKNGIAIVNSVHADNRLKNVFCRPTYSLLMAGHVKRREVYDPPNEKSIFFLGGHTHPLRDELVDKVMPRINASKNIGWEPARTGSYALSDIDHEQVQIFEKGMVDCLIALDPRGKGLDTSRFYEICFYGRVPVIIGDHQVLGEDYYDTTDFIFRIPESSSFDEKVRKIQDIR